MFVMIVCAFLKTDLVEVFKAVDINVLNQLCHHGMLKQLREETGTRDMRVTLELILRQGIYFRDCKNTF